MSSGVLGLTATTDSSGSFTLSNLNPGTYSLLVVASGFPALVEQVTVSASSAPITVQLPVGATLSGTITDQATSAAVANATVDLISTKSGLDVATVQADSNGDFEETDVAPGTYDLVFADPSGAHALSEISNVVIGTAPIVVNAELAAATINVQGTVSDAAGRPISGANVLILDSQGNVLTIATTDWSGAYSITTLPAGTYGVKVMTAGYSVSATKSLTLTGPGSVAGPQFSLAQAGIDGNPFSELAVGITVFAGHIVDGQLTQFNPANQQSPSQVRNSVTNLFNTADNDPVFCLPEVNASQALHLLLVTMQTHYSQWQSDYFKLIVVEDQFVGNLLADIAKLGLALLPLTNKMSAAKNAALTPEEFEFVCQFLDAASTVVQSLTNLTIDIINGNPPASFSSAAVTIVNTFASSLATAAGISDGHIGSLPAVLDFMKKRSGLVGFVGPLTAIVTIMSDAFNNGQTIMQAEIKCLNDKTTYLNDLKNAQNLITELQQAIADCAGHKATKPSSTPVPPAQPVAWSHVSLPNVIFVTSNGDSGSGVTLRAAIQQANASTATGPVEIDFSQLTDPTIMLTSPLPNIVHSIYLYGMTGPTCTMLVIDGSNVAHGARTGSGRRIQPGREQQHHPRCRLRELCG